MPKVIDNIELRLVDELKAMLTESYAADFCVGYFHLRGWRKLDSLIEQFQGGDGGCARVLVGMMRTPEEELRTSLSLEPAKPVDPREAKRRETKLVESFRDQLICGMPDASTESGLRRLAKQLRAEKVKVKLFLRYPLHAKLYFTYNTSHGAPRVSYVGSSNFTSPGLSDQGELNVDVTDVDATVKLQKWFEERWNDKFCVDISDLLAEIIEQSWASETLISPYHVYLKIAYHLAFEALEAPREYKLPTEFEDIVLDFQKEAILRVRRMLRTDPANPGRNRIAILSDVVGMGKTLCASAVAKLYLDDEGGRCIVCCPPKIKSMWEDYLRQYAIPGEVIPYSRTQNLAKLAGRCRLLILDESHNLRNRETLAWANLRDFIQDQEPKVLLLSATPYNKHYQDLGSQLRLVMDEKTDLGIRPEAYFRTTSEDIFYSRTQAPPRSLAAFEHSPFADDWKDLLKQFMVRRTRGYIIRNFAKFDKERDRHYLTLTSGIRSYFPKRVPKTLTFPIQEGDQYRQLFNERVVDTIGNLTLPRYGLGGYVDESKRAGAPAADLERLENLSQAGRRLIGYCRTNLFKRLESSGHPFLLSLERHALRNMVYVHAIDNGLDLPIGTQDSALLDTAVSDADADSEAQLLSSDVTEEEANQEDADRPEAASLAELQERAAEVYSTYSEGRLAGRRQFRWISSSYFRPELREHLLQDAQELLQIVDDVGDWNPTKDAKLDRLFQLLTTDEKNSKVLVFTQFADTADYLETELAHRGLKHVEDVTAESSNPADKIRRFSPTSNNYTLHSGEKPIRVLVATEVLSEGQNFQDASVVINYDLPWAIIRLIQRAGRVDRIGQDNPEIRIYSCLPAEGVEQLINLRRRLLVRLEQNQEVIGTDEQFFEEEKGARLSDIYAGKPGVLDGIDDMEDVDIPSLAKSIWDKALEADPSLQKKVLGLPEQVHATRHQEDDQGVLVYFKTADGFDSLVRVDTAGEMLTQSLTAILRQAECPPNEEPLPAHANHHELVRKGIKQAIQHEMETGGNLGPRTSARRKAYERLTGYRADLRAQHDLFASVQNAQLDKVIDDLFKYPLTERAREILNRRFREGISDADLAELAIGLRDDDRLSFVTENPEERTPRLICSVGMFPKSEVLPKEQSE